MVGRIVNGFTGAFVVVIGFFVVIIGFFVVVVAFVAVFVVVSGFREFGAF